MLKQAFDVGSLFSATMAAVNGGADSAAVVASGAKVLRGKPLAACVASFVSAEKSEEAIKGGKRAAADRAVELLEAKGVDITSTTAVRDALWPTFWTVAGGAGKPTKGDTDESATFYNTHFQAARRMALYITGASASEEADVSVPRKAQEAANALVAFEAKVQKLAMKRARDAAKKAKAKAK